MEEDEKKKIRKCVGLDIVLKLTDRKGQMVYLLCVFIFLNTRGAVAINLV